MDPTAIALYAQETGYLIRGLLVVCAIAVVAVIGQARLAERRGSALKRALRILVRSRRQSVARLRVARRLQSASDKRDARIAELVGTCIAFEAELKRIDTRYRLYKNATRHRQRALEDCQDEANGLRELVRQMVKH